MYVYNFKMDGKKEPSTELFIQYEDIMFSR